MLVTAQQVRARIDQMKLSRDGFLGQLNRLEMSGDRRQRLEAEVEILCHEISTLEKLLGVLRVEPDPVKVETVVRDRLEVLREASPRTSDESGSATDSGEERALLWTLGEDELSVAMRSVFGSSPKTTPGGAERALPGMLINNLHNATDPDTRASAAYELGLLHVTEAIPHLAQAANETGQLSEMALNALDKFSDEELIEAQISAQLVARVRAAAR